MGAYRISDTHPFTTNLVTTLLGVDPKATYNPGGQRLTTLAGTTVDVGYPRVTWTFASITVAQWSSLLALVGTYSGEVYIETRDDEDSWAEWRAVVRLPESGTLQRWGGRYQNVVLEFLLVEDVTPAGP